VPRTSHPGPPHVAMDTISRSYLERGTRWSTAAIVNGLWGSCWYQ
jgi:hypothetical protein